MGNEIPAKPPIAAHCDRPKRRACLACQEVFLSEWAGNRICPKCHAAQGRGRGVREPVSAGGRARRRRGPDD